MRIYDFTMFFFFFLFSFHAKAQQTEDAVVPITVEIDADAPSVTLHWELGTGVNAADLLVLRREKDSLVWFVFVDSVGADITTLTDPFVEPGKTYEYAIQRVVNTVVAFGYAMVPIEAPVVDNRGKVLLFVEEALENPLAEELARLEADMEGDGFHVVRHSVAPSETVDGIKSQIQIDYTQDPENVKMVFLLGEIPVPYSGNDNWDGHGDHQGAWVADTYYGDIDGVWTDNIVNNTSPSRPANDNVPGDGKFDDRIVPTPSELPVGRVDFSNLMEGTFGASHEELIKRYLDKNHNWRTKKYTAQEKALVDDNFGYFQGEAFAANGYRNFYPLVGKDNVVDGDFFMDSQNENWLFGYGCGGGSYVSAGGIGNSNDFASDSLNIVFSMLFGSYFGDWDSEDNPFMPSALASKGSILSCAWAGRPHWFFHPMAAGETLGYCTLETQNTFDNPGYVNYFGASGPHVTLLGDPTLRAHMVSPVTDLLIISNCSTVDLSWTASTETDIMGYHIYRTTDFNGGYTRITTDPITENFYTDTDPPIGFVQYSVKALVLEETPSGSYYNLSTGALDATFFGGGTAPSISAESETIDCDNPSASVTPTTDAELPSFEWAGPNNFSSNDENILVNTPGTYQVTVTDEVTGCTATTTVEVPADVMVPIANAGANMEINCISTEIKLDGTMSSIGGNYNYQWSTTNGNIVSGVNTTVATVNAAGTYKIIVTNTDNGCSAEDVVSVSEDIEEPQAVANNSMQIDCNVTSVNLDGTGSSLGPNYVYSWTTTNGNFISGANTLNPLVDECATYTIIVTNAVNGCTNTDDVIVSCNNATPGVSISGDFIIECNSFANLIATSTAPNSSYSWSGPGITEPSNPSQDINVPGDYSVIVIDNDNGCTSSSSVTVNQDTDLPQANPQANGSFDCNTSTGVLINANPDSDTYLLNWTGPNNFSSNEADITVNLPGTYSLTVTNMVNACTSNYSVVVEDNSTPPIANAGDDAELTCTVVIASLNGTASSSGPNIAYNWTTVDGNIVSGNTTTTVNVDACGTYELTVINTETGCENSDIVVVSCNTDLPIADAGDAMILDCITTEVVLNGQNSSSGTEYTYVWSGPGIVSGTNSLTPVVDAPGTYVLSVFNNLTGCESIAEVEVLSNQNLPDLMLSGHTQIPCVDVPAVLEASSTTAGAIVSWDGPGITDPSTWSQEISEPGTYTVSVLAPNSCLVSESIDLDLIPEMQIQMIASIDCDGFTTPNVAVSGGTGPFAYEYSPQPPFPPNTSYNITVIDAEGCTVEATGTTPDHIPIEINISHTDESAFGANDGTATADISNGTPPFDFFWSNGATTQTISDLAPGIYNVTITDANGCQKTDSVEIFEGPLSTGDIPGLTLFQVFPNPTDGIFQLNLILDNPKSLLIEILDVNGKRLQIAQTEIISSLQQQFDLSLFAAGVYWCKITAEGHSISKRIVKN